MKFTVPIYVMIDVPTPQHAAGTKQAIERLLRHEMVRVALAQAGVKPEQIFVADAVHTPHTGDQR